MFSYTCWGACRSGGCCTGRGSAAVRAQAAPASLYCGGRALLKLPSDALVQKVPAVGQMSSLMGVQGIDEQLLPAEEEGWDARGREGTYRT